jgi:hypothetical protein
MLILIGLFLALAAFAVLGTGRAVQEATETRPTSYSANRTGALGLFRWAQELGYDARRLEYRDFALGPDDAALVVLNPSEIFSRAQVRDLLAWIEDGGTLILADDSPVLFSPARPLLEELKIEPQLYTATLELERVPITQPAFDSPPVASMEANTARVLAPRADDWLKLAGPPDGTVVAGRRIGDGYAIVSAATHPFTNGGLRDRSNAALALNLLQRIPPGGRVLFDEIHHGYVVRPPAGSGLLGTAWGWAALYALAVAGLYLLLTGRRFGRPVPLREETARRSSAEYVESMADLFQRGGKRGFIMRYYYDSFKRRLARPYSINPRLDDDAFVRELARARPVDEAALRATLARLRETPPGEADLVRRVAEAEEMLEAITR